MYSVHCRQVQGLHQSCVVCMCVRERACGRVTHVRQCAHKVSLAPRETRDLASPMRHITKRNGHKRKRITCWHLIFSYIYQEQVHDHPTRRTQTLDLIQYSAYIHGTQEAPGAGECSDCPAGKFGIKPGASVGSEACIPCRTTCDQGQFLTACTSVLKDSTCTPWTGCEKGYKIIRPGSSTADTLCKYCGDENKPNNSIFITSGDCTWACLNEVTLHLV